MKNLHKTAKDFWYGKNVYPSYDNIKERWYHDVVNTWPYVKHHKYVLELGCGTGALAKSLHALCEFERLVLTEYNQVWVNDLKIHFSGDRRVEIGHQDLTKMTDIEPADITICYGVFPFLEDPIVEHLIDKIHGDALIKVPCTLKDEDVYINTYSEALDSEYASVYRTPESMHALLQRKFRLVTSRPCYPYEIDNKFQTRQNLFVCRM